jgi:hypothetical protein
VTLVPEGHEEVSARRARITAQVRRWAERAEVEWAHRDMSDEAAVLIATGRLDPAARETMARRRDAGRGVPDVGGFGDLRRLVDEHYRASARLAAAGPGAHLLLRRRLGELTRKIEAKRARFIAARGHFAKGVLAIRRERKEGLHLDIKQRNALFEALKHTPAPHVQPPTQRDAARGLGLSAARGLAKVAEAGALGEAARWATEMLKQAPVRPGRFADRYDTLLYLAGMLYDRITGSFAWNSEHFVMQRAQLNLADELIQISMDMAALRVIDAELAAALTSARVRDAREQILARQEAPGAVWNQLVERVSALARIGDLLVDAEERIRSAAAVQRAARMDTQIDELMARSGNRELSAELTHNVGDQFSDVDELLFAYRTYLYGDIAAITEGHRTSGR